MRTPADLPPPVTLTTARLLLRPWRPQDVDAVLAACCDPLVQRWTQVPVPYAREHAASYVEGAAQRWRDGEELGLAVCDRDGGALMASVGVRPGGDAVTWDVGCWAAPATRGRGVVPEAVAALSRWAVEELGAQRVQWRAATGNWASRRAAQRAGFTPEGVLRGGLQDRGQTVDAWLAARRPGDPDGDTALLPRMPDLRAGELVVRAWREDDADAVQDALGDGLVMPGMRAQQGRAPEDVARWWVREQAPSRQEQGAGLAAGVWQGGRLVGSLQVFLLGRRRGLCEVGVWVAPAARRQRVAARALTALLDWAQPALGLVRAEWVADVDNPASVGLAERLGFVREGVARAALDDDAGRRRDAVVLARTWPG